MAELDIETLKRKLEVPWSRLTADEGHAIIAALEDRERLRTALEQIAYGEPYKFGPQPNVWAESLRQIARAALESRDG